jgi:hypothetical protein
MILAQFMSVGGAPCTTSDGYRCCSSYKSSERIRHVAKVDETESEWDDGRTEY